ncbi:SDR family oxidoreductase [Microbacterium pseudoresistens]|uniref:NADP-dependent 3-hydroxy acid dehydrogenase YdfG n=1 Tax=Microbacterium pseudoresistens TaxID=640634 RepID=A0A7Y9ETF5_9MICO|nr:SDR family oxidoreductase [Microbacterium pseudoresistens]NYD53642.1 NADP-dependent 3-hydroxy acid dehydrogenase YdfG [Microbacterium pseudoresistens]
MTEMHRRVVLAGATSRAGLTIARALAAAGHEVISTGRTAERLAPLAEAGSGIEVADATSFEAMRTLAERIGPIDGVIPLVGGWRGGGGLAGQSDDDFEALLPSLQAVRATSRAFDAALRASPAGRFAIVSSVMVERPLAGSANYIALKAASEAWTRAVAQGYAKAARDADEPLRAAAGIVRVRGLDDVADRVAAHIAQLWDENAATLNGQVVEFV